MKADQYAAPLIAVFEKMDIDSPASVSDCKKQEREELNKVFKGLLSEISEIAKARNCLNGGTGFISVIEEINNKAKAIARRVTNKKGNIIYHEDWFAFLWNESGNPFKLKCNIPGAENKGNKDFVNLTLSTTRRRR